MHKKEKMMPWTMLIGVVLVMLSLLIGFGFNYVVLHQPFRTDTTKPPFGREALQPIATILTIVLFIAGLVLVYLGLEKVESTAVAR